ncbi:MAG TPA: MFS transporter [Steroidobacteraceae bacterium]|jgi:MFS family permease|nr:MFS transporter [Steroidobacteraceae bacterium]
MASDASAATPLAATVSEQWRPYQFYALVLLTLIVVLNYLDRYSLSLLQESIKHDLKLSDWQLGLLSGPAFTLFYSVGGIVLARYAERLHRGTILAAALGVWSTMTALCGAAGNFAQLALCRLGMGIGEGGCIPINLSLATETFSIRQRGLVMAIIGAGNPISGIITPLLIAAVARAFGWRDAFVAIGLPGVVIALLVHFTLRDPRARARGSVQHQATTSLVADARVLFGNPAFLLLFVAAIFTGMAVSGVGAFRVSYLMRTQGMDLTHAGAIWSIASAAGLLGAVAGGYLADHFADERGRSYPIVAAISLMLTFAGYFIGFTQSDPAVVMVALIAGSFTYNMKDGPVYAAVQNVVPKRMRTTGAALYMFAATSLGGASGPMLAGGVSDLVGAHHVHATLSAYAATCPGGRALPGVAANIGLCAQASADGLRWGLALLSAVFALAAIFDALASRSMHAREPA